MQRREHAVVEQGVRHRQGPETGQLPQERLDGHRRRVGDGRPPVADHLQRAQPPAGAPHDGLARALGDGERLGLPVAAHADEGDGGPQVRVGLHGLREPLAGAEEEAGGGARVANEADGLLQQRRGQREQPRAILGGGGGDRGLSLRRGGECGGLVEELACCMCGCMGGWVGGLGSVRCIYLSTWCNRPVADKRAREPASADSPGCEPTSMRAVILEISVLVFMK